MEHSLNDFFSYFRQPFYLIVIVKHLKKKKKTAFLSFSLSTPPSRSFSLTLFTLQIGYMVHDAEKINFQRDSFLTSPLPLPCLKQVCNEISWTYSIWRCFLHLVAKRETPITLSHTTGMIVGLSPIPAYQVLLSGVSYCVLAGLIWVWWQSPPGKSCKTFLLEYIALINFRHCLRCPQSSPRTIWIYTLMRFWPRTPEPFEIKLRMTLNVAIYIFLGRSKA